jgi:glycosyltransferase involved in cell wall biosynthesis
MVGNFQRALVFRQLKTMTPAPSKPLPVSAYIPCYNNAGTVGLTIQGIQNQTHPVDELFVVDDGSADNSAAIAEGLGVRVIRLGKNKGRGAVRAQAMEAARNELVLCCDATNRLAADFTETALKWFSSEEVVAVQGRWVDRNARTAIDRWRARHLFQEEILLQVGRRRNFCTHGAMARKSAVLRAGNYNGLLRHGEDFDLGLRLLAMGDVVFDPALEIEPVAHDTLFRVMERFTRWNRASIKTYTPLNFIESHIVAWRILIPQDLENRDWPAALISATVPYFAVAYADRRSFKFSIKSTLKKAPPPRTKN